MGKSLKTDRFTLGVCYYPEHWDEALWEEDFQRMKAMRFDIIRIAEFAWAIFEPEEGRYDFSLFDRALDAAHRHGLKVIMGTPTATPPAWLTTKYPEVLNATIDGLPYHHGARRHYNYSSTKYRELCANIVRRMAVHFKDHPAIVGWQIDNEFNCQIDTYYAEADHLAFREWLKRKYGTLDKLNQAWGTVFWSQTYTDWEQVHLTRRVVSNTPNPHQALDEKRFISDNTIDFAKVQTDILRDIAPHHWLTTNGLFGHLDSHRLTDEQLDFFSYDTYPLFATIFNDPNEEEPLLDRKWSLNLSAVRDVSPNFCVMEQQSGPGGWTNSIELPTPEPGQMRLWTYQSIAHGADMVLFFRWRTATVGTEMYWHGINDYHNQPNRRVAEATIIGEELQRLGEGLVGRRYVAEVALLDDYDNEWDGEHDTYPGALRGASYGAWYKQLQYRHIPADRVKLRTGVGLDELRKYKFVVYPHPAILTEETAMLLKEYVKGGGKVVFGARTGYKDETGRCRMMPFPGYAAELCGIHLEDFTRIAGTVKPALVRMVGEAAGLTAGAVAEAASEFPAIKFNDIIAVDQPSVTVEAEYTTAYYAGKPAMTCNRVGAGEAWYYGAAFSEAVVDKLINRLGLQSPVADWCELPRQVELAVRVDDAGEAWHFLLNYGANEAYIRVAEEVEDVISGEWLTGDATIPGYGVRILRKSDKS
ncbi:beta-galactosidase [Paenibacillus sp. GCM10012307]|uniref:Beta-galactosidase n=1 Tax=Paenibacillus roseus TaxID=2798579 RepID=A0A934MNL8_9BACL|nr:beta-galactosidase [Paenibacillus roseus]MBJ6361151.1 beta-galactosidase [Paenibacillus roseus]